MPLTGSTFQTMKGDPSPPLVYVIQEIPGTKAGTPKINIMSASKYGKFRFLFWLSRSLIFLF